MEKDSVDGAVKKVFSNNSKHTPFYKTNKAISELSEKSTMIVNLIRQLAVKLEPAEFEETMDLFRDTIYMLENEYFNISNRHRQKDRYKGTNGSNP